MPDSDEIRERQRRAWDGLSSGWERWDRVIMDQLAPVGTAMVDALEVADDQRHLDVAAGTGEPGLTVARRAPRGTVVLTDLSEAMLRVAARRADDQGIANVGLQVCSADALPFADGTFDSASVRFGLMFLPDLSRAAAELARILRPGGRACASVWVRPDANPWTAVAMDAIASEVALPPPDPDGPGMYRCAAPGAVGALLRAAGLIDVVEWDVPVQLVTSSPEQYWEMISEHVSLAVAALQQADDGARARIRAAALAGVAPFEDDDGLVRVPGLARCIAATKPSGPASNRAAPVVA